MPADLPVHVNRDTLHDVDVPPSFEADGSFDVRLINHGESVHVHVHLDDDLSRVARIDAANHYVEGDSERAVRVAVDESALSTEPIRGKIKVASAYGAETRWIDVRLVEADEEDDEVRVDESLAEPAEPVTESEPSPLANPEVPVLGLGALALLVAILAALVLQDTLVTVGALVVLGGVLVALYLLVAG
ncbi:MAG: hypothetical protein ABEH64_09140 [Salinirussus sp.]